MTRAINIVPTVEKAMEVIEANKNERNRLEWKRLSINVVLFLTYVVLHMQLLTYME